MRPPPGPSGRRRPVAREGGRGAVPGFEFDGPRPARNPLRTDHEGPDHEGTEPPWTDHEGTEPPRFRYAPAVSQPHSAPRDGPSLLSDGPARLWDGPSVPGFEFDARARTADPFSPGLFGADHFDPDQAASARTGPDQAASARTGPDQAGPDQAGPDQAGPDQAGPDQAGPARVAPAHAGPGRDAQPPAGAEWAGLLRSFLPEPVRRNWFSEFRAALHFRGAALRVGVPILAMMVFGVAVVVIAGANGGHAGSAPPPAELGFPPATLAGSQFTAAGNGRGISQTLGQVASDGAEIVAVGSQQGARIARAQFFVSADDGRSWAMGTVRTPGGGIPPPGYAARFVAGGPGAWVAIGPRSIWTSADGRIWTLSSTAGLPLLPGDQLSVLTRTADGFVAAGSNVQGGNQAEATPVIFLSANGTSWRRLGAGQLHLAAGTGRVLGIRYAASYGGRILIAGDVLAPPRAGQRGAAVSGAAWLSGDAGATWTLAVPPGAVPPGAVPPGAAPTGSGAGAQISGEAVTSAGFLLLRPAAAGRRPAVDVYRSADGTAWALAATLGTPDGFTAGAVNGGPDGAVVTGQAGPALTAFTSADGASWQRTAVYGRAASRDTSGAAVAQDGTVVTAGTTTSDPDSRQPLLTVLGTPGTPVTQVDIARIPGAADPQLAVNDVAAGGGLQVAVGSANGYPAAWTSTDGGSTWSRAAGQTPAALDRPGIQQLASVTYGPAGWLAVGGVTAAAPEHPVVITSPGGPMWTAADREAAFAEPGLFTEQAAAAKSGYVIVGYRLVAGRSIAAAWWSAGLTGWQRAGDAVPGALDGPGPGRQMQAVTAGPRGFVAVGADGDAPSAWTSPDGRAWTQVDVPLPVGAARAVLQHVASNGPAVAAVGTALTTAGQQVPFAASSSDGGSTWTESALPVPSGGGSVTALTAAGAGFVAAGTFGPTPGHQDVVVWTSPGAGSGAAWTALTPAGRGLTGPGIQAITALTASGGTLTGVGFTATPGGEQPVFWQSPVR